MAKPQKSNTEYKYISVTGEVQVIRLGEDGINEKWLSVLEADEHSVKLQERYHLEHISYKYLNAQTRNGLDLYSGYGDPLEQIADPCADIWNQLFPEEEKANQEVLKLQKLIKKLTKQQRKLLSALYDEQKTISEIARAEGVTHAAIQDRRRKIFSRLKKMLSEQ